MSNVVIVSLSKEHFASKEFIRWGSAAQNDPGSVRSYPCTMHFAVYMPSERKRWRLLADSSYPVQLSSKHETVRHQPPRTLPTMTTFKPVYALLLILAVLFLTTHVSGYDYMAQCIENNDSTCPPGLVCRYFFNMPITMCGPPHWSS